MSRRGRDRACISAVRAYIEDDTSEGGHPVFIRTQTNGSRTYLLIVENKRVDGRIQQVLDSLGRLDELRAAGSSTR